MSSGFGGAVVDGSTAGARVGGVELVTGVIVVLVAAVVSRERRAAAGAPSSSPPKTANPPTTRPASTTAAAPIVNARRRRLRSRHVHGRANVAVCVALVSAAPRLQEMSWSALVDADRLLRALPHGLVALLPQLVGRVLLEHVEEVVVANFEHFGDDAHADGIALAEVEVDHDLPGHCASRTRVNRWSADATTRREPRSRYETRVRRRAPITNTPPTTGAAIPISTNDGVSGEPVNASAAPAARAMWIASAPPGPVHPVAYAFLLPYT